MRPSNALALVAVLLSLCDNAVLAEESAAAAAPAASAPAIAIPAAEPAQSAPAPAAAATPGETPPSVPTTAPAPADASTTAPAATAPAATAPAATAPAAAAVPSAPGILVLPAEFTVFQHSTVATEPVPAWTEDAKRFLTESARRVLGTDNRFRLVEVPQLPAEQLGVLREHIELFKLIGSQIEGVVKPGGKVWKETRDNADYRVGNGLAFLHQQTGAKYAFVLAGAEIRQTGGSIFMQVLLAGLTGVYSVGAGTYMYAGVIDLDSGRLVWFGSLIGMQSMGISSGPDARKAGGADAAVSKMLVAYPGSIGLNLGAVASP